MSSCLLRRFVCCVVQCIVWVSLSCALVCHVDYSILWIRLLCTLVHCMYLYGSVYYVDISIVCVSLTYLSVCCVGQGPPFFQHALTIGLRYALLSIFYHLHLNFTLEYHMLETLTTSSTFPERQPNTTYLLLFPWSLCFLDHWTTLCVSPPCGLISLLVDYYVCPSV